MSDRPTCPQCQAALDDDLLSSSGSAECPFCGADVTRVLPLQGDAADGLQPPKKSKIDVVESTDSRLVLHIPPGGHNTKFLGVFAILWNGFMTVFTAGWGFAAFQGVAPGGFLVFPFVIIGLFWVVGAFLAGFWVKLRFTRMYLLLERERLVVQRILFNRKKTEDVDLTPSSEARLAESYRQNEQPVYRIEIEGSNRTAKFGTALSLAEKDWMVETINRFLGRTGTDGPSTIPKKCSSCGAALGQVTVDTDTGRFICPECGQSLSLLPTTTTSGGASGMLPGDEHAAPLNPAELPANSQVVLEESTPDRLTFHLRLLPGPLGRLISRFVFFGSAIVLAFVGFLLAMSILDAVANPAHLSTVFMRVFWCLAVCPIFFIATVLWRGRLSVEVAQPHSRVRYHWGPFGIRKKILTDDIDRIVLTSRMSNESGLSASYLFCVLKAGDKSLPLSFFHPHETAREVGGIVRWQLDRFGLGLVRS